MTKQIIEGGRDMKWIDVCRIASDSEPGKRHRIKRHPTTRALGCDCMAYRFAKGEGKSCKHVLAAIAMGFTSWPGADFGGPSRTGLGEVRKLIRAGQLDRAVDEIDAMLSGAIGARTVVGGETFRAISFTDF